jgi:hypothetical protein
MDELNQLVELDIYFKQYEVFKKYLATVKKQYESLQKIKNKIEKLPVPLREEDKSIAKSFDIAVSKIEEENSELSLKFEKFDFSDNTVNENYNDFKILCYKFVKSNIEKYLSQHIEKEGKFKNKEEFLYYVNRLEMMLWDFFTKNFIYDSLILSIFDSAKNDICDKRKNNFIQQL